MTRIRLPWSLESVTWEHANNRCDSYSRVMPRCNLRRVETYLHPSATGSKPIYLDKVCCRMTIHGRNTLVCDPRERFHQHSLALILVRYTWFLVSFWFWLLAKPVIEYCRNTRHKIKVTPLLVRFTRVEDVNLREIRNDAWVNHSALCTCK